MKLDRICIVSGSGEGPFHVALYVLTFTIMTRYHTFGILTEINFGMVTARIEFLRKTKLEHGMVHPFKGVVRRHSLCLYREASDLL